MVDLKHTRIRQASKIADVTYILPMEASEARQKVDSIRGHLMEACEQLVELHERQGWKALGYTSMVECMRAEFDMSKSRGYQLLSYVKVRHNIEKSPKNSTMVENSPQINERQARPLAKLPAKVQAKAWTEAVESAPDHQPTAKHVATVAQRYGVTRPAPKPKATGRKAHGQGVRQSAADLRTRCKGLLDTASERLVQEVYDWLKEELEGSA